VGLAIFGVPHVGLFFGFCFVFGLFCVVCWDVDAAFFSTQLHGFSLFCVWAHAETSNKPTTSKIKND
jgi:hypothetical protein